MLPLPPHFLLLLTVTLASVLSASAQHQERELPLSHADRRVRDAAKGSDLTAVGKRRHHGSRMVGSDGSVALALGGQQLVEEVVTIVMLNWERPQNVLRIGKACPSCP